ncbi:unnamed protein product [Urochloa decumbens]|uniref:Uncharacterized protein n=1 Tax=Urochloa decumbens TaxID=240449 RepID=A0ABC9GJH1_9POAL
MARSFTGAAAAFLLVAMMAVPSAHAGRALIERNAREADGNAAVRLPGLDFLMKLGEGVLADAAFVPKKGRVPGIHRYKKVPILGP